MTQKYNYKDDSAMAGETMAQTLLMSRQHLDFLHSKRGEVVNTIAKSKEAIEESLVLLSSEGRRDQSN